MGGKSQTICLGRSAVKSRDREILFCHWRANLKGYGLTEASPVTHVNRQKTTTDVCPPYKFGSIGPLIGWNKQGTKNPYEPEKHKLSDSGELMVKGPNVMIGIWKRPEETAEALEDGWRHLLEI